MSEETSLPLARMVSINKPFFWLFIAGCMFLYVYNKAITPDNDYKASHQLINTLIIGAAFIGLFITLVGSLITNKNVSRTFNTICYGYEVVSICFLMWLILR